MTPGQKEASLDDFKTPDVVFACLLSVRRPTDIQPGVSGRHGFEKAKHNTRREGGWGVGAGGVGSDLAHADEFLDMVLTIFRSLVAKFAYSPNVDRSSIRLHKDLPFLDQSVHCLLLSIYFLGHIFSEILKETISVNLCVCICACAVKEMYCQ